MQSCEPNQTQSDPNANSTNTNLAWTQFNMSWPKHNPLTQINNSAMLDSLWKAEYDAFFN